MTDEARNFDRRAQVQFCGYVCVFRSSFPEKLFIPVAEQIVQMYQTCMVNDGGEI